MIPQVNFIAAWVGITLGIVSGIVMGLRFHHDDWLGGYATWPRRMIRLGHISFFGLAFVNLAFALSMQRFGNFDPNGEVAPIVTPCIGLAGWLFTLAAVLMPLICYLSAWRKPIRSFFALPAGALLGGVLATLFVWKVLVIP